MENENEVVELRVFYHPGGVLTANGASWTALWGWYFLAPKFFGRLTHVGGAYDSEAKAQKAFGVHMYHREWSQLWQQAQINMPHRIRFIEEWQQQEPGTTPFSDFLLKAPKGEYKLENQRVYRLIKQEVWYGEQSLLANVLGMLTKNKHTGKMQ